MRYHTLLLGLLITVFSFCFTTHAEAQSSSQLPKWEIRAGMGLVPTFLKDHTQSELQPISLELRYRANAKFSIGLLAGSSISQALQEHHTGETRSVRNDFRMAALRGAVHSNPYEKWEVYGGIVLGYSHSQVTYTEVEPEKNNDPTFFPKAPQRNGLLFSGFIGSNYRVYKNINVFGEIGYGLSLATIGTSLRF